MQESPKGKKIEQHLDEEMLSQILYRQKKINPCKSLTNIDFLGHRVRNDGVEHKIPPGKR
jgi:hypothetical protein